MTYPYPSEHGSSKHPQRAFILPIIAALLLTIVPTSCLHRSDNPTEEPRKAMQAALDAQLRGDDDAYIQHIDFALDADSTALPLYRILFLQQKQRMKATRGGLMSAHIDTVRLLSDTVAGVFFTEIYANGDSVPSYHKLVRKQGVWRIRVRN